jgi:uncharacterized RDD family membrane protein YckC
MENISIQTSQNIDIEQTVASIGERLVAEAIDLLILSIYMMIIAMMVTASKSVGLFLILMLPAFFYQLICELAMDGQSWGKKIMKIKVVKIDGTQPTFNSFLVRWMFRLVDVLMLFGGVATLVIIINGKGQRLGDIVANTTVIRLKDDSSESGIFTTLPDNYTLKFLQVSRLNDSDIQVAKDVLNFLKESYYSGSAREMCEKARTALETKMGIQSDLASEKFLKTVIYDYNYIHSRN